MIELKCSYKGCDKKIEGFTHKHAQWLMSQHILKHMNDEKEAQRKKKND